MPVFHVIQKMSALHLEGGVKHVNVPHYADSNLGLTENFTIEFWVYVKDNSFNGGAFIPIAAKTPGTGNLVALSNGYRIAVTSAYLFIGLSSDTGSNVNGQGDESCQGNYAFAKGWHHCVITKTPGYNNASNYKFYADGNLLTTSNFASTLTAGSLTTSTESLKLGGKYGFNTFYYGSCYLSKFSLYKRILALPEIKILFKEQSIAVDYTSLALCLPFLHYRGNKVTNFAATNFDGTLVGFSDTEIAASGYSQKSNTVWVQADSLLQYKEPDNSVNTSIVYRYEYINAVGGATFPAPSSPFYQVYGAGGWERMIYCTTRIPIGLVTFEDGKHIYVEQATLMNKPHVYRVTIQNNPNSDYWRQGTEDRIDHHITQTYYT